jgi:hypothetical protein
MTQAQARQRLLDYVYGEMTPGDCVAFEGFAREDPELQAELDDVAFVRRAIAGLLEARELPATARRRILAAAHRATWQRAWARWWVAVRASLLTPAFLGTAAVVVAVGLAVPWIREQGRVPLGAPTDTESQTGVPTPGGQATPREINGAPTPEPRPREFVEPRPVDAARLLSDARNARAAGRNTEALALCNRALAAEPSGDVLADVLAEAAEIARELSREVEADVYLDRLERLPGGAERAARIRGGP